VLTGEVPHTGVNLNEVMRQLLFGKTARPRDLNPTVPVELEAVCAVAMAATRTTGIRRRRRWPTTCGRGWPASRWRSATAAASAASGTSSPAGGEVGGYGAVG